MEDPPTVEVRYAPTDALCSVCSHPMDAHKSWISKPANRDTALERKCQVQITVAKQGGESHSWLCTCHSASII